jgi:preprotein translocase subunit SecG
MWIETLVLICHLLVALTIVLLVLLQRGRGAEAGTGFGAGASGTVFGARGSASFFSRATAVLATLFFATSLALAYLATKTGGPETLIGEAPSRPAEPAVESTADEPPTITVPDSVAPSEPEAGASSPESGGGDDAGQ